MGPWGTALFPGTTITARVNAVHMNTVVTIPMTRGRARGAVSSSPQHLRPWDTMLLHCPKFAVTIGRTWPHRSEFQVTFTLCNWCARAANHHRETELLFFSSTFGY